MPKASDGIGLIGQGLPALTLDLIDEKGSVEKMTLPIRISTTNQITLQQMCEQGMGIARLFYLDARPSLERGSLVRVLPRLRLPTYDLRFDNVDKQQRGRNSQGTCGT
jgi:DNA-binding transcriptional LysR family regulator